MSATEDELAQSVGWLMVQTGQRMAAHVAAELTALELDLRRYVVLSTVATGPPRTQIELSQHLGIDKSLLVIALDRLQSQGLVRREVSPTDRRARIIEATDAGRELATRAHRRVLVAERELLDRLSGHGTGDRTAGQVLHDLCSALLRLTDARDDPGAC